jgi:hypothetical protein
MQKVTASKPVMWGASIVGFGTYHYVYASGREGDWMMMGFSPRKQNLTLYIMPGLAPYAALLRKLGPHSTGKSCLYIKRLEDLDLTVLEAILTQAAADLKAWTAESHARRAGRQGRGASGRS